MISNTTTSNYAAYQPYLQYNTTPITPVQKITPIEKGEQSASDNKNDAKNNDDTKTYRPQSKLSSSMMNTINNAKSGNSQGEQQITTKRAISAYTKV